MRVNILQAGLVTYMMAGRGFLPKEDEPSQRREDREKHGEKHRENWHNIAPPVLPLPAQAVTKADHH